MGEVRQAESVSETSEETHSHLCGLCGDVWFHANAECEPVYGSRVTTVRRCGEHASCPEHEGMRREDL